jgi:hypothetical protein
VPDSQSEENGRRLGKRVAGLKKNVVVRDEV